MPPKTGSKRSYRNKGKSSSPESDEDKQAHGKKKQNPGAKSAPDSASAPPAPAPAPPGSTLGQAIGHNTPQGDSSRHSNESLPRLREVFPEFGIHTPGAGSLSRESIRLPGIHSFDYPPGEFPQSSGSEVYIDRNLVYQSVSSPHSSQSSSYGQEIFRSDEEDASLNIRVPRRTRTASSKESKMPIFTSEIYLEPDTYGDTADLPEPSATLGSQSGYARGQGFPAAMRRHLGGSHSSAQTPSRSTRPPLQGPTSEYSFGGQGSGPGMQLLPPQNPRMPAYASSESHRNISYTSQPLPPGPGQSSEGRGLQSTAATQRKPHARYQVGKEVLRPSPTFPPEKCPEDWTPWWFGGEKRMRMSPGWLYIFKGADKSKRGLSCHPPSEDRKPLPEILEGIGNEELDKYLMVKTGIRDYRELKAKDIGVYNDHRNWVSHFTKMMWPRYDAAMSKKKTDQGTTSASGDISGDDSHLAQMTASSLIQTPSNPFVPEEPQAARSQVPQGLGPLVKPSDVYSTGSAAFSNDPQLIAPLEVDGIKVRRRIFDQPSGRKDIVGAQIPDIHQFIWRDDSIQLLRDECRIPLFLDWADFIWNWRNFAWPQVSNEGYSCWVIWYLIGPIGGKKRQNHKLSKGARKWCENLERQMKRASKAGKIPRYKEEGKAHEKGLLIDQKYKTPIPWEPQPTGWVPLASYLDESIREKEIEPFT